MENLKLIFISLVLVIVLVIAWQMCASIMANMEFKEDLHDVTGQGATRIGLAPPNSDDDLRNTIVRKANQHDIQLSPSQVTVQRSGPAKAPTIYLTVHYAPPIKLFGLSFPLLHFAPSSSD